MEKNRIFLLGVVLFLLFPHAVYANGFDYPPDQDGQLVIVIDPGHGGENLGADYNGFVEKDMNLIVANAMYEELSKYEDVTIYMTRSQDVDMSLQERADFATSVQADFLFCLHFNMSPSNNLFGSEVWISGFGEENRQGYRFGTIQMDTMEEMGLYIRGVKTRLNDKGTDYYGILRNCTEYAIPAALIEHCHVDQSRDDVFCDSEEKLKAFGKADATSVAKYFKLSSSILDISYIDYDQSLETVDGQVYMPEDLTDPDVCYIEKDYVDYENGMVGLILTAQDYDTPMLYYAYSIDGGDIYSDLLPWPETDIMGGSSPDSFRFTIEIKENTIPRILVRGYNQYDHFTESNILEGFGAFHTTQQEVEPDPGREDTTEQTDESAHREDLPVTSEAFVDEELSILTFFQVCFACVLLLFLILLLTKAVVSKKRRNAHKKKRL